MKLDTHVLALDGEARSLELRLGRLERLPDHVRHLDRPGALRPPPMGRLELAGSAAHASVAAFAQAWTAE